MLMRVLALFCRIWKARNWVVFDSTLFTPVVLLSQFNRQVAEWEAVPLSGITSFPALGIGLGGGGGVSRGVQDREGAMWVFMDGAVRSGSHGAGGWVLEDSSGTLLGVAATLYPDVQDPFLVELLALRDGIR
ncbi:unnamed protein product [Linum trigynum]|uniref:RNase H type-1 domain-containing protein n=1 Tax=Linum trigynum TaxID=586398 RepID=A0AAV2EM86_9ROSI